MTILVIDPGLSAAGVLVYREGRIVEVATIKTATATDPDGALARCAEVSGRICALALSHEVTEVVMEWYRDIPGHLRGVRGRWMTPLMIGWTARSLVGLGYHITWQDPERVMREYRVHMDAWKERAFGIIHGDDALTNEHLRSAGAHLLAYLATVRVESGLRTGRGQ